MLLKTAFSLTLFTSALGFAGPGDFNVFTPRSFVPPDTKNKIPPTNKVLTMPLDPGKVKMDSARVVLQGDGTCAIPLMEAKAAKTGDKLSIPMSGSRRGFDAMAIPPPIHACKDWNKK